MSFERLKEYTVEANENRLSFKVAPKTTKEKLRETLLYSFLLGAPLFLVIVSLTSINHSIPHVTIGVIWLLITIPSLIFGFKHDKKHRQLFCFTIDEIGITLTDEKGAFHISWLDVAAFGVVTHVPYGRGRVHSYMSHIYFSTAVQEERYIRTQANSIKSDNSTIVFPLYLDDVGAECLSTCEYIYRYCNKEKQKNFYEITAYLVNENFEQPWYIKEYEEKDYLHNRRLQLKDFVCSDKHCTLCRKGFGNISEKPCNGYYDRSSESWICKTCYNDFKELFRWSEN